MTSENDADPVLAVNLAQTDFDLTAGIPPAEHLHESVRRVRHAGHEIEIRTHYTVLIDGVEFPDPIHVSNDGSVHYHGFPQYSAPSAVDIVKLIVERQLEGDLPPLIGEPGPGGGHGGHPGGDR